MRIINAIEMRKMPPGTVFCDYKPDIMTSDLMVIDNYKGITENAFGATKVIPWHAEVVDYDWNSDEYDNHELFMIFDNNDILQMIQTLTQSLNIDLKEDY